MPDKFQQQQTMRWVLFWIFTSAFVLILIATLSTVFLELGKPTPKERDLLFNAFVIEIGVAIVTLFYALFGLRKSDSKKENECLRSAPFSRESVETKVIDDAVNQISKINRVLPLQELLPKLRDLFDRSSYREPVLDCPGMEWHLRVRANLLNERLLRHHRSSIDKLGSQEQRTLYSNLINNVSSYSNTLFELFTGSLKRGDFENYVENYKTFVKKFPDDPENMERNAKEMFVAGGNDQKKVTDCELFIVNISDIWEEMGENPSLAPEIRQKSLDRLLKAKVISQNRYDELSNDANSENL